MAHSEIAENTNKNTHEINTNPNLVPYNEEFAYIFQNDSPRASHVVTSHLDLTDPYAGLTKAQLAANRENDKQEPGDKYNENTKFAGHIGDIQNSDVVIPNLLYRGANPGGSNDESHEWSGKSLIEGLQALKEKGVTVDVDLEKPKGKDPVYAARIEAEKQACEELGIKFVNIPLNHKTPDQGDKDQLIDVINQAKADGGEVYVHCREGRDRTGYMIGYAQEQLQGLTPQQAFANEVAHGYNDFKQEKFPGLDIRTN